MESPLDKTKEKLKKFLVKRHCARKGCRRVFQALPWSQEKFCSDYCKSWRDWEDRRYSEVKFSDIVDCWLKGMTSREAATALGVSRRKIYNASKDSFVCWRKNPKDRVVPDEFSGENENKEE